MKNLEEIKQVYFNASHLVEDEVYLQCSYLTYTEINDALDILMNELILKDTMINELTKGNNNNNGID